MWKCLNDSLGDQSRNHRISQKARADSETGIYIHTIKRCKKVVLCCAGFSIPTQISNSKKYVLYSESMQFLFHLRFWLKNVADAWHDHSKGFLNWHVLFIHCFILYNLQYSKLGHKRNDQEVGGAVTVCLLTILDFKIDFKTINQLKPSQWFHSIIANHF